jgi:hypothetical protein
MKKAQSSVIVAVVLVIISLILITVILTVILIKPSLLDYNKNYEQKIVVEKPKDYDNNNRQPLCYPPYRVFGLSCCLDSNYNGICDNDEKPKQTEIVEYCELPYIKVGSSCCLDDNRNGRCDLNDYGRYYENDYYTSDNAYLNSPFYLYDYSVGSDRITLYIKNIASETITLVDLEIDDCEKIDSGDTLAKNEKKRFSFDCDRDYNFDRDITITYQKEGSNETRTSSGNIERDDRS